MNVKTATTEVGAKNGYPAGKIYKQSMVNIIDTNLLKALHCKITR